MRILLHGLFQPTPMLLVHQAPLVLASILPLSFGSTGIRRQLAVVLVNVWDGFQDRYHEARRNQQKSLDHGNVQVLLAVTLRYSPPIRLARTLLCSAGLEKQLFHSLELSNATSVADIGDIFLGCHKRTGYLIVQQEPIPELAGTSASNRLLDTPDKCAEQRMVNTCKQLAERHAG